MTRINVTLRLVSTSFLIALGGCASSPPKVSFDQGSPMALNGAPVVYLQDDRARLTLGTIKPLEAKFATKHADPMSAEGWELYWFNPSRMLEPYVFERLLPDDQIIFERYLVDNTIEKTGFKRGNKKSFAWSLMICPPGSKDQSGCGLVTKVELKRKTVSENPRTLYRLEELSGFKVADQATYMSKVAEIKRVEDAERAAYAEREKAESVRRELAGARMKEEERKIEELMSKAKPGTTIQCDSNNGSPSLTCGYPVRTEWTHMQNIQRMIQTGWIIASQVNIPQTNAFGQSFILTRYIFQKR